MVADFFGAIQESLRLRLRSQMMKTRSRLESGPLRNSKIDLA